MELLHLWRVSKELPTPVSAPVSQPATVVRLDSSWRKVSPLGGGGAECWSCWVFFYHLVPHCTMTTTVCGHRVCCCWATPSLPTRFFLSPSKVLTERKSLTISATSEKQNHSPPHPNVFDNEFYQLINQWKAWLSSSGQDEPDNLNMTYVSYNKLQKFQEVKLQWQLKDRKLEKIKRLIKANESSYRRNNYSPPKNNKCEVTPARLEREERQEAIWLDHNM